MVLVPIFFQARQQTNKSPVPDRQKLLPANVAPAANTDDYVLFAPAANTDDYDLMDKCGGDQGDKELDDPLDADYDDEVEEGGDNGKVEQVQQDLSITTVVLPKTLEQLNYLSGVGSIKMNSFPRKHLVPYAANTKVCMKVHILRTSYLVLKQ